MKRIIFALALLMVMTGCAEREPSCFHTDYTLITGSDTSKLILNWRTEVKPALNTTVISSMDKSCAHWNSRPH